LFPPPVQTPNQIKTHSTNQETNLNGPTLQKEVQLALPMPHRVSGVARDDVDEECPEAEHMISEGDEVGQNRSSLVG